MIRIQDIAVALFFVGCSTLQAQTVNTGATFGDVIPLNGTPSDLVLDEARQRVYMVNPSANRVDILSMGTRKLMKSVNTGTYPLSAAMSPDGAFLYVTCTQSASISVIDLGTDSSSRSVSLPAKPEGIAVGADGRVLITTQG